MPKQFFPGVEKGVRAVAEKGPMAGYPVIDFKAVLYDGSFHTVDYSPPQILSVAPAAGSGWFTAGCWGS